MKISVIMPVYNGEKYLREAIDSILNQTFSDFEFIIINDCSSDSTEDIIKSYEDSRIVYIKNEENLGVAGTLNKGLELAKGEFIARMDADDISLPTRFEKQLKFMEDSPEVGVLGSNAVVFSETSEIITDFPEAESEFIFNLFFSSQIIHPSVMARRKLIDDGLYKYNPRWEGREDYALWLYLVNHTKLANFKEPLLKYRVHNLQVTQNRNENTLHEHSILKHEFLNRMGIEVDLSEAKIFSKCCIGINKLTRAEYKIYCEILNKIKSMYNVPERQISNAKKRVKIIKPEKSAYIITCHDVYNYGAALQAYALQSHLEKLALDVKIIDYKAPYLSPLFDFKAVPEKFKKNPILNFLFKCYLFKIYIPAIPKYFRYKNFNRKFLNLTSKSYKDNEGLKNLPARDMYFCGSDQIWNSYNYPCGKDPAFFLDFAPQNSAKFSYAASFGTDKIDKNYTSFTKDMLSHFDAISVREESGKQILNRIGVKDVELVSDPVFLLSENEWHKLSSNHKFRKPYVLIYAFDNKEKASQIAFKIADNFNYDIKNFAFNNKQYSSGPKEFLNLIKNAEVIVTNSFHAIAFSLIFKKQFVVVNRTEKGLSERLDNILKISDLENRKISDAEQAISLFEEKIDYSERTKNIQEFANKSKEFIERCIDIEKSKHIRD